MMLRSRKSFTIIEALIAIVLVAITTFAFFASLMTSFGFLRRISELQTATLILQEEAAIVRELPFSGIQALPAGFTVSGMSTLNSAQGTVIKTTYGGHNDILKITFRLDWTAFDGKPARRSVVTLMTNMGINKK